MRVEGCLVSFGLRLEEFLEARDYMVNLGSQLKAFWDGGTNCVKRAKVYYGAGGLKLCHTFPRRTSKP